MGTIHATIMRTIGLDAAMDTLPPESLSLAAKIAIGVVVLLALLVIFILRRGRALPGEHVFRASRLSKGNRLFPTQVVISDSSVTHYTPEWVGKREESIHLSHVSSIKIDTNIMFSDVFIETTGGHNPVICHGHSKGDAVEMKRLIEQLQSAFYKKGD